MSVVRKVSEFELHRDVSDVLVRGEEPSEIVLGSLAFIALFGAGASKEEARFMDVPIRVDIKMINPHGWRVVTRRVAPIPGFQTRARGVDAFVFALFGMAVSFVLYAVLLACGGPR